MKRFAQFIKTLHENLYSKTIERITSENVPCAIFAPFFYGGVDAKRALIERIRNRNVNLKYLFSVESEEFQNPPTDIKVLGIYAPPPPLKPKFVFYISNRYTEPTLIRFIDFGIETLEIDFDDSHANQLYDFFLAHTDEFFELYSAFQDDLSRETLLSHILGNVSGKKSCLKNSITLRSVQYGFMPQNGGIVIDAGAYDGGIAAMFADFGYKVFSFEVDPEKFKIASKLAETKNFVLENIGLADFERDGKYFTDGAVTTMGSIDFSGINDGIKFQNDIQNVPIKLTTIDSYVREKKLPRVDLMNLSVVGSELAVIRGAANTIARFKPIMILQCYKELKDLIALYKTLKEIRPDYEFACRTGYFTSTDAKIMFSEDVMKYCANFGLIPKTIDRGGLFLFAR